MALRRIGVVWPVSLAMLVSLAGWPCVAGAVTVPRFSAAVWQTVGVDPDRIVAADLDGDATPDLATADWNSSTVSVQFGTGTGSFGRRIGYRTGKHPGDVAVSDVNSDGRPDLVSASVDGPGSISVFLNQGARRFSRAGTYASGPRAYAVAAADINHDGAVDLVTAHDTRKHFSVLLGQGGGRLGVAQEYDGARAFDVALGDLNADGELDVVRWRGRCSSVRLVQCP